ncbi:cell division ATP-binding protein FtsE, partial [Aduncisulcus paluster]
MLAVSDINLHVKKGDFVFLVGPSGAGKSTVIKMLLKEENCTKGRLYVDDMEIT